MRALHGIIIPVLSDAMDRSLALAAAMDVRGYGRTGGIPLRTRLITGVLVIAGLIGVCVGVYGLMDGTTRALGQPLLIAGLLVAGAGFLVGGRRVRKTVYRPDRWRPADIVVAASGIATAAVLYLSASIDGANLYPSLTPLRWPEFAVAPAGPAARSPPAAARPTARPPPPRQPRRARPATPSASASGWPTRSPHRHRRPWWPAADRHRSRRVVPPR